MSTPEQWVEIGKMLEEMVDNGACPALLFDDNNHWIVTQEGMQTLPDEKGVIRYLEFWTEEDSIWRDTPYEAVLDAYTEWLRMRGEGDEEVDLGIDIGGEPND